MTETITVNISDGTLRGRKASSISGKPYYSFQGIPYAKPPIGPLRFQVAEPPEPWSGVRDALKEDNTCTQFNQIVLKYEGYEDCLYLNVYSPQIPCDGSPSNLKPVMVWIHGGGFVCGSGNADMTGPDFLVDEDVVIVTINYRLGILGFLYLNDSSVPGNVGLKDQLEALRWVQKNIAKFGGDPGNITIFGESAGGASVSYLMLSPLSKGLFHKAIAQSGAAFNPWAVEQHPREMAFRVGKALGFNGNSSEELVKFLRGVDHIELVKSATDHGLSEEDKLRILPFAFVPTVEVAADGEKIFLPAHPLELLEKGSYQNVPYMTGFTDKEGLFGYKRNSYEEKEVQEKIEKDFSKIILPDLRLPEKYTKTQEVISKLRHFFLNDKPVCNETLPGLIDMCSDIQFSEGVYTTVQKMAQHAKSDVYYYTFSYDGKFNFLKVFMDIKQPGACHGDDLGYLFHLDMVDALPKGSPQDELTRARMVKMWTNFAKTGNPTPTEDPIIGVTWQPYTVTNSCYLHIKEELAIEQNPCEERVKFWNELYSNL